MVTLSEQDKQILELVQNDFPLTERPFHDLALSIGTTEQELLDKLHVLCNQNLIRDISAILNADALGYTSALVAAKLPQNQFDVLAAQISEHPGVSHNYERDAEYNLWFTLTVPAHATHAREIETMLGVDADFMVLPAIETYKIGVHFRFDSQRFEHEQAFVKRTKDVVPIDETDKQIIRLIQKPIPLVAQPWILLANQIGIDGSVFIARLQFFKSSGILKRISATLRHRHIGVSANGMVCFAVSEDELAKASAIVAAHPSVTHCYQRPAFPQWPFRLYAMIHARKREDCQAIVDGLLQQLNNPLHRLLFSTRELKKERVRYTF